MNRGSAREREVRETGREEGGVEGWAYERGGGVRKERIEGKYEFVCFIPGTAS